MVDVLVAEDEPHIRRMIFEEFLTDEGYQVVAVADGRSALSYLRQAQQLPCVVIADHMMPNLNGADLCRQIQADPALAHLPLVLISAGANAAALAAALGVEFLDKPFGLMDLLALVQRHCGTRP